MKKRLLVLKKAFTDENFRSTSRLPATYNNSFEWPWEAWNKLPEIVKKDIYESLSLLSWIPILGTGAMSATFTLKLFEGNWEDAAYTLVFIIISFYLSNNVGKQVSLLKRTGKIVTDSLAEIIKDISARSILIDVLTNEVNIILDNVVSVLSDTNSLKDLSRYVSYEKDNLKKYISDNLQRYSS